MRATRRGLALLAAALGACGVQAQQAGRESAAITNGQLDGDDPAVVAIVGADGRLACTGTLIAPHVVLTAAHCGVTSTSRFDFQVVFGPSVDAGTRVAISGALVHPQYDAASFANDLALLAIGDGPTVTPVATLTSSAASALPSASVRVVGYGETAADAPASLGVKRSGTSLVTSVTATTFAVAPAPALQCSGDSGGPAFVTVGATELLAGVISRGDAQCLSDDTETRVDAFGAFVQPFVDAAAPGTIVAGQPCWYEGHCARGTCATAPEDDRIRYCAPPCAADVDCPAGMRCASSSSGARCEYPPPTPGALGSACTSDGDCLDGACVTAGSSPVCGRRCDPVNPSCPSGFACVHASGISFDCLPASATSPSPSKGCGISRARTSGRTSMIALALALAHTVARRLARRTAARS